jgi:hypothetical protein
LGACTSRFNRRHQEFGRVFSGRFLGDEGFEEELLGQMHQRRGGHYGAELREADAAHAEGVVAEDLRRRGREEAELTLRRKADPEKVEMAWRSRHETTMTLKWVAKRLKLGAWTHVSNCLVQKRKENEIHPYC